MSLAPLVRTLIEPGRQAMCNTRAEVGCEFRPRIQAVQPVIGKALLSRQA
jgi:hypothetical protein